MKATIYDHKGKAGVLRKWADQRARDSGDVEVIAEENPTLAIEALLKSDHPVLLVHLEPNSWKSLMDNVGADVTVFRFSTVGFVPTPPAGKHANGFFVNPRTENDKGEPESETLLREIFAAICKEDDLRILRSGLVPANMRKFISFFVPHLARALHIYLQGRLAQWAADPKHPNCTEAKTLLPHVESMPMFQHEIDWQRVLRSILSASAFSSDLDDDQILIGSGLGIFCRELGIKADSEKSPIPEIRSFLQLALSDQPAEAQLASIKNAWNTLLATLRMQREEFS